MDRYIYPPSFRSKMAELWKLPEIRHWWLPHDEGYPAIIRDIRSFIEDRAMQSYSQPGSEDLRNIKANFSNLSVQGDAEEDNARAQSAEYGSHTQRSRQGEPLYPGNRQPADMDMAPSGNAESWW